MRDSFISSNAIQLHTDAASTLGFGCICGKQWFYGSFPVSWSSFHISIKEFYPILLGVKIWGHLWRNHCILFFTDNEALVPIINEQTSKDDILLSMVRWLVLQCIRLNILFKAKHIPGKQNVLADNLSRLQIEDFCKNAP